MLRLLAFATLAVFASCAKPQVHPLIKKMQSLRSQSCACQNLQCARDVLGQFEHALQPYRQENVDEATFKAVMDETQSIEACLRKAGIREDEFASITKRLGPDT